MVRIFLLNDIHKAVAQFTSARNIDSLQLGIEVHSILSFDDRHPFYFLATGSVINQKYRRILRTDEQTTGSFIQGHIARVGCSGAPGISNCSPLNVNNLDFVGGINSDKEFSAGAIDENLSRMSSYLYSALNVIGLWIDNGDVSIIPSGILSAIARVQLVRHRIVSYSVHPGS